MTARVIRFIVVALVATSIGVGTRPGAAFACSCVMPPAPVHQLGAAQVAFVGTPINTNRVEPNEQQWESVVYTFRVEVVVKGELPATIQIFTGSGGGDCGVQFPLDKPVGLLPYGSTQAGQTRWSAGSCGGVMTPDDLLQAATEELPAPTSTDPIATLIGGRYGPAGAVALDADGETVGWLLADSTFTPTTFAACPGGRTVLALSGSEPTLVTTIDLGTLTITEQRELPAVAATELRWTAATRLYCTTADGGGAVAFVSALYYDPTMISRVAVLDGRTIDEYPLGRSADLAVVDPDRAVVVVDDTVLELTLSTGVTQPLATLLDRVALTAVVDGETVVIVAGTPLDEFQFEVDSLVRVPLGGGEPTRTPIAPISSWGPRIEALESDWLVSGLGESAHLLTPDGRLEPVGVQAFPMTAGVLLADWESSSIRHADGTIGDLPVPMTEIRASVIVTDGPVVAAGLPASSAMSGAADNGVVVGEPGTAGPAAPSGAVEPGAADSPADMRWIIVGAAALALLAGAVVVRGSRRRRQPVG